MNDSKAYTVEGVTRWKAGNGIGAETANPENSLQ